MSKSRYVIVQSSTLGIGERFRVEMKVFEVAKGPKYPDGIKSSFTLIDSESKKMCLLIDNHAPFGYHLHRRRSDGTFRRETLTITNHLDAEDIFWFEAERIIADEEG